LKIENYALIGDCETAALVGNNGSIDWLCWPNFGAAACFASLLGREENGFWRLAPAVPLRSSRRYLPNTLILETNYEGTQGAVKVLDFMPPHNAHSHLVRIVQGLRGKVPMHGELVLRFSYGIAVPWVTRTASGLRAVAGPDAVDLHTTAPLKGERLRTMSDFEVGEGEEVSFVLTYGTYGDYQEHSTGTPIDTQNALEQAKDFWTSWAGRCTYDGPYREQVIRSLLTLKALTFEPTGGMVAAPTTSIPEDIGGVRNWDYRYCWLRDTTFTLLALMNGGYFEEGQQWMQWLRRTIAGKPGQLQIMYGLAGERILPEWELKWLPGYEGSSPVRVGNAASEQLQLDTYGEVLDAFFWMNTSLDPEARTSDFSFLRRLVLHLESIWQQPDHGIWEVRGGPKHFTYSKVMAWVAFDRAVKIAEEGPYDAPIDRWKKTRDAIHQEVCTRGFDKERNSFVQHYDTTQLDASTLLMPMVGFLPAEDPRIQGTISAIERNLMQDGFVMRYDTSKTEDGLPGSEGKFLACSFWLVNNLKMIGREDDARKLFEHLLSLTNDVGLLSEEYDTKRRRLVGNFPQALSHLALIGAAYQLSQTGVQRHEADHQ
jgi:GH15 family glucan-1,4-alpha-glucosidase